MEGGTVIKRPVVFTLAELEKYPTLADRYAVTLPFKLCDIDCGCWEGEWCKASCYFCHVCKPPASFTRLRAKCIKRTGERWTWFSAARDKDDKCGERLGTLIYLPWEIRQKIIKALFSRRCDYNREITSQTFTPGTYWDIFPARMTKFGGIRFASPSTKVEFEHHYLTKTNFSFDSPQILEDFLDRLSPYHRSLLRSFILEISSPWPLDDYFANLASWMTVCARLPPNLVSIKFKLWENDVTGGEMGGPWWPWYDRGYPEDFDGMLSLLEIVIARVRRCAARAKLGLVDIDMNRPIDGIRVRVVEAFHELEPWSKSWLEWWEEDTKIDFDDVEGGSNVA